MFNLFKVSPGFLKQLWLTLGSSLAFLVIGLVRGYSSSAIPSMVLYNPDLINTTDKKSWIGSIPPLGAFTGSMMSGVLMQRTGRKKTLQLAAPLWAGAWLLLGFATSYPLVLLGRILCGLCVGLTLAPVQVYVSECCDPEIRGRLGSLPSLSMSLGILLSYIAGNWLAWRALAFLSAGFCGLLFINLLPLPESPVWLKAQGLDHEASTKWLHLSARSTATMEEADDADNKTDSRSKTDTEVLPSLFTKEVFFSASVLKPMMIGFSLLFLQQFSGIDSIIFFTVEIFQSAESTLDAMTATIVVGVVQLICNGVSTSLVDKAGRRPLLMVSAVIMSAANTAMGLSYFYHNSGLYWIGYLPVISLVVFMIGFSIGFGVLPFVLLGELFPAHHRSQLSSMAGAVNLLSMFTVIKTFHIFDAALTPAGTFWLYAGFTALAFVFVIFLVPETKGKTLAEIEEHFGRKSKTKDKDVTMNSIS